MSSAPRLPPLSWLRAFEAAGRHESFRAAAAELHLTPSAISHHGRALESRLGQPLFERAPNRVLLTAEGRAYLARVSAGFAELAAAAEVLVPREASRRLVVGAFPFLASEVLLPGLPALQARLPGVAISVVSETGLERLTDADPARRVDAIVRYGTGRFPGCLCRRLTAVDLVPVAAPGYARGRDPRALVSRGPRIAVSGPFGGWQVWSEGAGVPLDAGGAEVLTVDNYQTAMRAAEQGVGVGLGIRPFVDAWLRQGRLAVLLNHPVPAGQSSYLVTPQHSEGRPELAVLASWLEGLFQPAG